MTYGSMSSSLSQILAVQGQDSILVGLILEAFLQACSEGHHSWVIITSSICFENSFSGGRSLQNKTAFSPRLVNLIVIFVTFLDCASLV